MKWIWQKPFSTSASLFFSSAQRRISFSTSSVQNTVSSWKKNQYTLIVKLLRTFVFRSAGTREKKVGGMFYFLLPIRSLSLWSTFSCLASVSASSFSIISAASARFLADFWNIRSALAKKIQDFQPTLRKRSHFLHFSSFSFLHICWEIVAELPRLKIPIIFMRLNLFFEIWTFQSKRVC